MLSSVSISFPNLGIELENVKNSLSIFGIDVAFYGIIIGFGMLMAMILAFHDAKVSGQNVDDYVDLALYGIIFAIIGARIYYVIFEWDYYRDHLGEIINLRKGGLAIYGGIIGGVIVCFVLSRIKKLSVWKMLDTGAIGLVTGQMIGRWGNFFNREAYGGDTNSLFAMRINIKDPNVNVTVQKGVTVINDSYIQVHPTFLYESFWNLCILIFIQIFKKKKKFQGEVFLWYMTAYGFGRFFIESLRTDQLKLWHTGIPVSMFLSAVIVVVGAALIIINRVRIARQESTVVVGEVVVFNKFAEMSGKKLLETAMDYAENAHEGQMWKMSDGTDVSYFEGHLMGVYQILKNDENADEEMLITAMLHDTIEDTAVTYQDILDRFGKNIAENVKWLSKGKNVPYEDYIDELLKNGSDIAVIVKLADRLHNTRNLMNMGSEKWHEKKITQAEYMMDRFAERQVEKKYQKIKEKLISSIKNGIDHVND